MKIKTILGFVTLSLAAAICLPAQEYKEKEPAFYRLDFVVKEVEAGKVINSRLYSSMLASGTDRGSIRTGNRVPVPSGSGGGFTYVDVGINVDFNSAKEVGERLYLSVMVDVSTAPPSETAGLPPIIRSNKWSAGVVVPLRKATTIFTSDDTASKRQMQLELTATPVK